MQRRYLCRQLKLKTPGVRYASPVLKSIALNQEGNKHEAKLDIHRFHTYQHCTENDRLGQSPRVFPMMSSRYGVRFPNGCQVIPIEAANSKAPFPQMIPNLKMHELDPGISSDARSGPNGEPLPILLKQTSPIHGLENGVSYSGQFGLIPFDTSLRLPRHVHITVSNNQNQQHRPPPIGKFVTERILVLNGVALVELNGQIYVVAPRTLVTIAPGVPHTWTACPVGVKLPSNGEVTGPTQHGESEKQKPQMVVSNGEFLMVYEYEEVTGFFPTEQTETLDGLEEYVRYEGDLQRIRFSELDAEGVVEKGKVVVGNQVLWMRDLSE